MPLRVSGQSSGAGADTATRVWGSLALGPSTASAGEFRNEGQLFGADLSVWRTRDKLALAIRTATAGKVFDAGDVYDVAALAGIHPRTEPGSDVVAGLGVGFSRGHDTGGGNLRTTPVIAAGAQVTFNYRFVGVGLDAFAGVGQSRRYYGVGLALAVGRFR
jgi:hypothetical protein